MPRRPVQIGAFKALDVLATTYPWPGALQVQARVSLLALYSHRLSTQAAGYVPLLVKIAKDSESIDVKIVALKVLSGVTAPGTPGQVCL